MRRLILVILAFAACGCNEKHKETMTEYTRKRLVQEYEKRMAKLDPRIEIAGPVLVGPYGATLKLAPGATIYHLLISQGKNEFIVKNGPVLVITEGGVRNVTFRVDDPKKWRLTNKE